MKGYLDTSASSTTTIDVSGLAEGAYDIYVYADGNTSCRAVGWRADMGWMWTSGYHAGNTDYYGSAIYAVDGLVQRLRGFN